MGGTRGLQVTTKRRQVRGRQAFGCGTHQ
jgi:hypothetical protein